MMKCLIFILWLNLPLLAGLSATERSAVMETLMSTEPAKADMALVKPDLRAGVLAELRFEAKEKDPDRATRAFVYLLRLGDPQAMKDLISTFEDFQNPAAWELRNIVEQAGQPLLLPLLIPFLDSTTFARKFPHITESSGQADQAAELIKATVLGSSAFSREVRRWLRGMFWCNPPAPEDCQQIKLWWKLNKEAFEARDYAKVLPLRAGKLAVKHPDIIHKWEDQDFMDVDIASIPNDQRASLIAALREEVADENENAARRSLMEALLVRLGDEETTARLVKAFANHRHGGFPSVEYRALSVAREPSVLVRIAPFLYSTAPRFGGGDVSYLTQAEETAEMFRDTIMYSSVFSADLKEWSSAHGFDVRGMQCLWEQNGAAFKAAEYGKVKPPVTSHAK